VIVPHGLLHQTPFHALHDGASYLIDRYEIVYAPSVAVLTQAGERAAAEGHALLVGVADPLIPAVNDEIAAIKRLLPQAMTLTGPQATLPALLAAAPGCATLHLACHGLFRDDNPIFSALRLADGWLTAAEIAKLDLRGALVALSACESGRGQVFGGDEVIGLARAFVAAGTRTLLVSLWLAQDTTTAHLMETWYAHMQGGDSPAAALRAAQLAARGQEPHPYYWAPFITIGQR
jgi:CHAT domain-containing protein